MACEMFFECLQDELRQRHDASTTSRPVRRRNDYGIRREQLAEHRPPAEGDDEAVAVQHVEEVDVAPSSHLPARACSRVKSGFVARRPLFLDYDVSSNASTNWL